MITKTIKINTRYSITEYGNVFNRKRGTELKQQLNSKGYPRVFLWFGNKGKPIAVHRLVAITFLRKSKNRNEVNHKDGDKLNNHFSNLEWCTRLENVRHYHKNLRR